jgi:hypothetical protein
MLSVPYHGTHEKRNNEVNHVTRDTEVYVIFWKKY